MQNAYPAVGKDLKAYSLFQFLKLVNFPREKFYLCGKLLPKQKSAIFLWSAQAEFQIETNAELVWEGTPGSAGDWVALVIDPAVAEKTDHGLRLTGETLVAHRLVASGKVINSSKVTADQLRLKVRFLEQLKTQLKSLGLEEIETPYLVPNPGMEPTLEPFLTEWKWGERRSPFYLPTSPELHLKKMLARGWTDIFEVKTCFRNAELSECHEPEFLMLEWYRAFHDLEAIKTDLKALLDGFYEADLIRGSRPAVKETSYAELFREYVGFDLKPTTTRGELFEECQRHKLSPLSEDSWDDLFFRLSLERIEPRLAELGPLIIRDFPPSQSALARLTSDGWADRFEFYWQGFEIANAFHELNDPNEQERRFGDEIEKRRRIGTAPLKPDSEFLEYLKQGMPPAAGIALGVERLLLACQDETELKTYRAFSFKNPLL